MSSPALARRSGFVSDSGVHLDFIVPSSPNTQSKGAELLQREAQGPSPPTLGPSSGSHGAAGNPWFRAFLCPHGRRHGAQRCEVTRGLT